MLALLIAARVGPAVARIARTVVEVISLAAMTAGLVLALAAVTWAAIAITHWRLRRRTPAANSTWIVAPQSIRLSASRAISPADCLACGGTGMVLRAISSNRYQPQDCPVCEPARRAG
jgi:methionine-rich copper-binding protein CopC